MFSNHSAKTFVPLLSIQFPLNLCMYMYTCMYLLCVHMCVYYLPVCNFMCIHVCAVMYVPSNVYTYVHMDVHSCSVINTHACMHASKHCVNLFYFSICTRAFHFNQYLDIIIMLIQKSLFCLKKWGISLFLVHLNCVPRKYVFQLLEL